MVTADTQFLCISGLLKARPVTEGARRFLYMEASNEAIDLQGEKVLAKSLADSADHFLRYGNIDLDHRTLLPARPGENPYFWEIGQPVEAQIDGSRTFVKAELYTGDGPTAVNANMVWESLTAMNPPARWYPSVGGQILERTADIDPLTKARVNLISRVRWSNVGLSRSPVNNAVPSVATVPIGVLTKCCSPAGLDLAKAIAAGYGTDSAALTDGAALRHQSLDPQMQAVMPVPHDLLLKDTDARPDYAAIRDQLAGKMRPAALAEMLVSEYGFPHEEALAYVQRFFRDFLSAARHGVPV
jgi:hypothetical protein